MDPHQLRCFVTAAEELHFGRAAQKLAMLPAACGRFNRLLEDDLTTRLMIRTTRSVVLTEKGQILLDTNFVSGMNKLPLVVAWLKGSRDPLRLDSLAPLEQNLTRYSIQA